MAPLARRRGRRRVRQPHARRASARSQGGMPLYKYVGNRSSPPSRTRCWARSSPSSTAATASTRVAALARDPVSSSTPTTSTSTPRSSSSSSTPSSASLELPIPTYYGDEICRVNGMKYAQGRDARRRCRTSAAPLGRALPAHASTPAARANAHYDLKLGYASSHTYALDAVPAGASVLDIGCGPGRHRRASWRRRAATSRSSTSIAPAALRQPVVRRSPQDLDDEPSRFDVGDYDYILLLDVIEHLRDPERFLEQLRRQFDYEPKTLMLTTPNIAFIVQRLCCCSASSTTARRHSRSHAHAAVHLPQPCGGCSSDAGFRIKEMRGVPAPFPKVLGDGAARPRPAQGQRARHPGPAARCSRTRRSS